MAIERRPEHQNYVGRCEEHVHHARILSSDAAYFVWDVAANVEGFAIFTRLAERHRLAHLKRIAVRAPGSGMGGAMLAALLRWAFTEKGVHRIELDVFPHNTRAHRAYVRAGFVEEGVMRECILGEDGEYRSLVIMALLRPEWERRT